MQPREHGERQSIITKKRSEIRIHFVAYNRRLCKGYKNIFDDQITN